MRDGVCYSFCQGGWEGEGGREEVDDGCLCLPCRISISLCDPESCLTRGCQDFGVSADARAKTHVRAAASKWKETDIGLREGDLPAYAASLSYSPATNIKNRINRLLSTRDTLLSLKTSSLLPGTLVAFPFAFPSPSPVLLSPLPSASSPPSPHASATASSCPCHTDTPSKSLKPTYLLTPESINVCIRLPRLGNRAGYRERAYCRFWAARVVGRGEGA